MLINHNYAILATVEERNAAGRFAVTITFELGNELSYQVPNVTDFETLLDAQIPRPPVKYRGPSYLQIIE